jgi:hypothetical protein
LIPEKLGLFYRQMNAVAVPLPRKSELRIAILVLLLAGILLGWATFHLMSVQPIPVPLKPCKTCTQGCPCPRLSGEVRCGCAE